MQKNKENNFNTKFPNFSPNNAPNSFNIDPGHSQDPLDNFVFLGKVNEELLFVPEDILVKNILFYLDINSLPIFSRLNKSCNRSVKIHMFIRLYFLNKEKTMIVQDNRKIIDDIVKKRNGFLVNLSMPLPSLSKAQALINRLSKNDLK